MEGETAAAERGAVDKAIANLLFQGGLRRSKAAALRWADVPDGTAADVLCLKTGAPWRSAGFAT